MAAKSRRWGLAFGLCCAVVLLIGQTAAAQRLSYSEGQVVWPAFEGWEEDADGTRYFLFGYMNRNWDEEPDVSIGPDNDIQPGGPDLGQPTHFLPRRNRFVFRVPVPEDFDDDDEMVWTLTVRGVTKQAYATLRQDYYVDGIVRASENGAIGGGGNDGTIQQNTPPTLTIEGDQHRMVRVGEPLTLVASATDDGIPATNVQRRVSGERGDTRWLPRTRITVNSEVGLRLSWFAYRGGGHVTFDPPQAKVWEDTRTGANSPWAPHWQTPAQPDDGRWETRVTFDDAGTYVLRCRASDGALDADRDVTVTVVP